MSYTNIEVPHIMEGDLQAALAREELLTKEIVRLKAELSEHKNLLRTLNVMREKLKWMEEEVDRRNNRIVALQIKLIKLHNRNIFKRILNRYE